MTKKKVLFLVGSLGLGGIERLTRDLSIALKKTGCWEPAVCCLLARSGPFLVELEAAGIPVLECRLEPNNFLTFSKRLGNIVRQNNPDLVHSHVDFSMPWQVLGARLGGVRKIVFTQHNDYQFWKHHLAARLRIRLYFWVSWPFISAYTAVSKGVQRSVAHLALRSESDFPVIYNPVDTLAFRPDAERRAAARMAMGVGDEQFVIGNVARFAEQKGHSILVQSAQEVVRARPKTHFVLVGDGILRPLIEAQVKEAGLVKYFSFLGQRMDMKDLYPGFDAFVLPSLWEGFPLSMIEAMSCGLPVVATSVGGVGEALNDETGLLIPPADTHALTEALITLQSQPELSKALGDTARQSVLARFSLDNIVEQYIKLYKTVLMGQRS